MDLSIIMLLIGLFIGAYLCYVVFVSKEQHLSQKLEAEIEHYKQLKLNIEAQIFADLMANQEFARKYGLPFPRNADILGQDLTPPRAFNYSEALKDQIESY